MDLAPQPKFLVMRTAHLNPYKRSRKGVRKRCGKKEPPHGSAGSWAFAGRSPVAELRGGGGKQGSEWGPQAKEPGGVRVGKGFYCPAGAPKYKEENANSADWWPWPVP